MKGESEYNKFVSQAFGRLVARCTGYEARVNVFYLCAVVDPVAKGAVVVLTTWEATSLEAGVGEAVETVSKLGGDVVVGGTCDTRVVTY